MKKLGLSLMAIFGMFLVTQNLQAQETDVNTETEVEADNAVEMDADVETQAAVQQDYQSIDVAALPQAVKDAVMTDFDGAVTDEAWVKEKDGTKTYKLSLSIDGDTKIVYADEKGNWVEDDEGDDK